MMKIDHICGQADFHTEVIQSMGEHCHHKHDMNSSDGVME
jgi:hypothetical protein